MIRFQSRSKTAIAFIMAVTLLLLVGCGVTTTQPTAPDSGSAPLTAISVATHETGSSYHAVGSGLAKVVSDHTSMSMTVKPFSGPNAWMPLLARKELELGVLSWPDAAWAFEGISGYPQPALNARLVMVGNELVLAGLVARKDSGIMTSADVKGKRVAYGYGGVFISQLIVEAHLASVGLTWDDIVKVPVSNPPMGFELLREGRVDATFGVGVTAPVAMEAHAAVGLRTFGFADHPPAQVASFPEAARKEVLARIPGAKNPVIKAGKGYVEEDVIGIAYPIVLIGSSHVPEEAIYQVVKALWENYEELHPVHALLKGWVPDAMFSDAQDMPYHDGAVRFYKEIGVWNDKAEKRQQELLANAS